MSSEAGSTAVFLAYRGVIIARFVEAGESEKEGKKVIASAGARMMRGLDGEWPLLEAKRRCRYTEAVGSKKVPRCCCDEMRMGADDHLQQCLWTAMDAVA